MDLWSRSTSAYNPVPGPAMDELSCPQCGFPLRNFFHLQRHGASSHGRVYDYGRDWNEVRTHGTGPQQIPCQWTTAQPTSVPPSSNATCYPNPQITIGGNGPSAFKPYRRAQAPADRTMLAHGPAVPAARSSNVAFPLKAQSTALPSTPTKPNARRPVVKNRREPPHLTRAKFVHLRDELSWLKNHATPPGGSLLRPLRLDGSDGHYVDTRPRPFVERGGTAAGHQFRMWGDSMF